MGTSSAKSDRPSPAGAGKRVALVASRYHEEICNRLLEGAREALLESGVADTDIVVYRVPGAFELPLALQAVANTESFDAAVALGVVIRGETSHYEFVAGEAAAGIRDVILKTGLPVGFGLLTTEDEAQAKARAGSERGNKGFEAAQVALEMANLLEEIEK